jgi:hypothetical protein
VTKGVYYSDNGQVTLRVAMKDPGSATSPTSPSTTNFITVTRYRVQFRRTDGHNVEGVDVPAAFEGGMTLTVTDTGVTGAFTLVRAQSKTSAPLLALAPPLPPLPPLPPGTILGSILTLADVTFYGTDQAGHAVTVTGTITVDFADWADPS